MDAPKLLEGTLHSGATPPAASSVSQNSSSLNFIEIPVVRVPPAARATPLGRSEAQIAFLNLMGDRKTSGAWDVTNEVGFAWKRYLQNQFQKQDLAFAKTIIGPGICKVLVVCFECDSDPRLVLCRVDDSYVVINPNAARGVKWSICIHDAWSEHHLLSGASTAPTPWMQIRRFVYTTACMRLHCMRALAQTRQISDVTPLA
jgi:hypothetical protein